LWKKVVNMTLIDIVIALCSLIVQRSYHTADMFWFVNNNTNLSIEIATKLNIDDVEQITSIAI